MIQPKKQVAGFVTVPTISNGPAGPVVGQMEIMKVFSLDTKLEKVMEYAQEQKRSQRIVLVFEHELPERLEDASSTSG